MLCATRSPATAMIIVSRSNFLPLCMQVLVGNLKLFANRQRRGNTGWGEQHELQEEGGKKIKICVGAGWAE